MSAKPPRHCVRVEIRIRPPLVAVTPGILDATTLMSGLFSFCRSALSEMKCPPMPDNRRASNPCSCGDKYDCFPAIVRTVSSRVAELTIEYRLMRS